MSRSRQIQSKTVSETRNVAVSFAGVLDDGELLTGTPTVSATGVTVSGAAVTSAAMTILGESVPAGEAVKFAVTGGTAGRYVIAVTCATNSTPAQSLRGSVTLDVVAD